MCIVFTCRTIKKCLSFETTLIVGLVPRHVIVVRSLRDEKVFGPMSYTRPDKDLKKPLLTVDVLEVT